MKPAWKDAPGTLGLFLFILCIVALVVGECWVKIHYIIKFW